MNEFDDVLLVVDTVSSFSALPIPTDEIGVDVLLAGVQKAMALPPGLSVFVVSEKALKRAETTNDRGYYFDFLEFEKNHQKNNTPSTPSISLLYALDSMVSSIMEEGLENRFRRHSETNAQVHKWVEENGFELFAPDGFRSKTLTAVENNRSIDVPAFIKAVRERHNFLINGGYGKIKGKTFRISNMGNETPSTMDELLRALSEVLPEFT